MFEVGQEVVFGNGPVITGEVVEWDDSTVLIRFTDPFTRRVMVEPIPLTAVGVVG